MELQGINKYPVLSRPGQQPPQTTATRPYPLQQQPVYPHYVQMAPNNGTMPTKIHYYNPNQPMLTPGQHPPQKFAPPLQHHHQGQLPYPKFAPNKIPHTGVPHPQFQQLSHPTQQPMSHTSDAYYYDPAQNQYFAYTPSASSTEYYSEMSQPLSLAQEPSDNQGLLTKYSELEATAQSFKCVAIIHKVIRCMTIVSVIGLMILVVAGGAFPNAFRYDRSGLGSLCHDILRVFGKRDVRLVSLGAILFGILVAVFHKFALRVYEQRRAKAMNRLYHFYRVLLALNILTIHPISIAIFGYLTYAAGKLRTIFKEMEEIKTQLAAQGIDPTNQSLSTTVIA